MNGNFSVLMSVYIKEKPEYLEQCFNSLLSQTLKANEWVVVEDGPISGKMDKLIACYEAKYPNLIKRIKLSENRGLGIALRTGVPKCKNEIIARMDTDDIARNDRFEKQLQLLKENPEVDICGSHIIEFEGTIENEISRRTVPIKHDEIVKYQKTRSAFNHMTVMFKKSAVLKAGNYEDCPLMEDDLLWTRMILSGAKCANVDDYLVYARTGKAMIERRGGWEYFKKYRRGKKIIKETGFINNYQYCSAILPQLIVSIVPKTIRRYIFVHLLRH